MMSGFLSWAICNGCAPSANDRILASRLGEAAIQALMEGQRNVMIGIRNNEIVYVLLSRQSKGQAY